VAAITRRPTGFVLHHVEGSDRVAVNGTPVGRTPCPCTMAIPSPWREPPCSFHKLEWVDRLMSYLSKIYCASRSP
jgi:hypothetical protein